MADFADDEADYCQDSTSISSVHCQSDIFISLKRRESRGRLSRLRKIV